VKDSRKTSNGILKRLVQSGCSAALALCAGHALAYDGWIEDHIAASYDYSLLKVSAAGRTVLLAASDPADGDASKGKSTFDAKCALCHSIGAGDKIGPDLKGVTRRHPDKWLTWWLLETDRMQKTDLEAKALLAKYKTPMPNLGLKPSEVRELLQFLHWSDQNGLAKN
jgi:mono/diheme cytochrome c family protein